MDASGEPVDASSGALDASGEAPEGETGRLTHPAGCRKHPADHYDYDAFGNLLVSSGSTPNLYLDNGQQLDPNIGFYYLRARYYDPAIGRFVTTDPLGGNVFDPPSLHPYIYSYSKPINRSDPSGKTSLAEIAIVSAIIGALAGIYTYAVTGSAKEGLYAFFKWTALSFGAGVVLLYTLYYLGLVEITGSIGVPVAARILQVTRVIVVIVEDGSAARFLQLRNMLIGFAATQRGMKILAGVYELLAEWLALGIFGDPDTATFREGLEILRFIGTLIH